MNILVVCEPWRVIIVGPNGMVSPILEGPLKTTGNPYLVFGEIIRKQLGVNPIDTNITVATVTSGTLKII